MTQLVVQQFEQKRQRLSPGYSPQTDRDLVDWVKERLIIPEPEWESLLNAIHNDHQLELDELLRSANDKLVRVNIPRASKPLIAAVETIPRIRWLYGGVEGVEVEALSQSTSKPQELLFPLNGCNEQTDLGSTQAITAMLGEWLQFYGPATAEFIQETLGIESEQLQLMLDDLADSQSIVIGQLVSDTDRQTICDSENFEILLRLTRRDAIPAFEPLEFEWLPVLLAEFQRLTTPANDVEGLFACIEQLVCYPAQAGLWESEILPARLYPYAASWLDTIMMEGNLRWIGIETRRIAFCFDSDLDLLQEEYSTGANEPADTECVNTERFDVCTQGMDKPEIEGIDTLFPDEASRYDFASLLRTSTLSAAQLTAQLWEFVWAGLITNDTFMSLRRGVQNKFKHPEVGASSGHSRHRRFSRRAEFGRWKSSSSYIGNWHRLPSLELSGDIIEAEERKKDRARLLLNRYGILFRELLQRELPAFRWSEIFRTLRIMELSGEVLAGCFFHGIPGPQFISHQAFRRLNRQLPDNKIFWMNAADPASLCGVQLDGVKGMMPKRVPSTHVVYRGRTIVMISERNGKALRFKVPHDDPQMQECLGVLHHLLRREFQPMPRITIETINGDDAARSPYADELRTAFDVTIDYKHLILYRKAV